MPQPPFQNQCPLILLSPLFQPLGQDQQNGKHCHLPPQSFRITLKDTSSNISIEPIGLSSLHKFQIFSQTCISHHGCKKYANLWCSEQWKMELQVKKIESRHFYYPKAKLSPRSLSSPPGKRQITHFPQLRGEL